jgi:hypothetical protein
MDLSNILTEIDKQIAQLHQAKALLTDSSAPRKVGLPAKAGTVTIAVPGRKPLSAEAKARIAAAQKMRWAKVKKAAPVAAKKTAPAPAKKTPAKKKVAAPAKGVAVKTA